MSTLPSVEQILGETKVPMSVREIVEYSKGSLPTKSKTPDTVVARDLSMDIKRNGGDSRFARVAPGRYTLRAYAGQSTSDSGSPAEQGQPTPILASAMKAERAGVLASREPAQRDSSIPVEPLNSANSGQ
jgi:hypothetical protein